MVKVEIIYITAEKTVVQIPCVLSAGSTVGDALAVSGILNTHPEIEKLSLGIFSEKVTANTLLKNGDRVEIYRPLLNDPKEKRRLHAKKSLKR